MKKVPKMVHHLQELTDLNDALLIELDDDINAIIEGMAENEDYIFVDMAINVIPGTEFTQPFLLFSLGFEPYPRED